MPHSVPVSKLMTSPNEWPRIQGDLGVCKTVKLLRIITEDQKLEHGHSPLVMDDNYNLLGFVHLTDLLKSIKPLWEQPGGLDECPDGPPIKDLVVPFVASVNPDDRMLKALDIMMEHKVSMVPVLENGKLVGMLRLSDVFNTVIALLFGDESSDDVAELLKEFHV